MDLLLSMYTLTHIIPIVVNLLYCTRAVKSVALVYFFTAVTLRFTLFWMSLPPVKANMNQSLDSKPGNRNASSVRKHKLSFRIYKIQTPSMNSDMPSLSSIHSADQSN